MFVFISLQFVWTALTQVREWVQHLPGYKPLALVLFAFLIGCVGLALGLSTEEIAYLVIVILALAVGAWAINSALPPIQRQVVQWTLVFGFIAITAAGCFTLVKRLCFPPQRVQPVRFEEKFIDVESGLPMAMLRPPNLPVSASEIERQLAAQEKMLEWIRDGIVWVPPDANGKVGKDPTAGAVVLKSKGQFADTFQTIKGKVELADHIEIEDGITLLRSVQSGRYVYRQMSCKPEVKGNGVTFTLEVPKPNEELIMILRIRTTDGSELDRNVKTYRINVRVDQ